MMATTFADILRQQQGLQQQQAQIGQQRSQNMMSGGQLGGKMLANALRSKAAAGPGGAGSQLGQPLVTGQMGASSMAGGAGAGASPFLAAMVAQNADRIGNEAGRFGDKMGLKKTGLPDQARMYGNFVKGDFGSAWGNLKDSVKNIFSIF